MIKYALLTVEGEDVWLEKNHYQTAFKRSILKTVHKTMLWECGWWLAGLASPGPVRISGGGATSLWCIGQSATSTHTREH